jgi:hypothetical protein
MIDRSFGGIGVQDTDLLSRLNNYCDHLGQRLEQGQGWLIFNSAHDRGARILRLLASRLGGYGPTLDFCHLPWRDFALHTYISTVTLPQDAALIATEEEGSQRRREYTLATGVTNATAFQIAHADLLVLSGINPTTLPEVLALSQATSNRIARHRATIALTAHDPWSLARAFNEADSTGTTWTQFYEAMRRASLIAH